MREQNSGHKRKLIQRYAENAASEKELQSLFGLMGIDEMDEFIEEDMDRHIERLTTRDQSGKIRRPWLKYIAASLILIGFSVFAIYLVSEDSDKKNIVKNNTSILPGNNLAYLTLSSGKRVALNDLNSGEVLNESGVQIKKTAEGQLVYTVSDQQNDDETPRYNTIETPKGGQYHILLPDGSKVWLNAASSLKYPSSFTKSNQRLVFLNGEAYFEISTDKARPFIVHSASQEVKVLGTHFNINAYTDEPETTTTLIEGAVSISPLINDAADFSAERRLKPGDQALRNNSGIRIKHVDTEEAIAWKNGQFVFSSESITAIMRKISRWYNVDISYDGNVSALRFTGTLSRYAQVTEVLQMLEMTNKVEFKVKGREIKVSPGKGKQTITIQTK
ncbi:FecR family protein [Pedobacter africanus]|uniref:FecR family protein n=1 Tax=Pedobacter africanus TaxID=151894 RepID=A0A1W2CZE7_9SPHI|nr:FecR domain-containing protein [Pedobacter africanus]SMC90326.1 FecR family protein [Pedobacter africanus]